MSERRGVVPTAIGVLFTAFGVGVGIHAQLRVSDVDDSIARLASGGGGTALGQARGTPGAHAAGSRGPALVVEETTSEPATDEHGAPTTRHLTERRFVPFEVETARGVVKVRPAAVEHVYGPIALDQSSGPPGNVTQVQQIRVDPGTTVAVVGDAAGDAIEGLVWIEIGGSKELRTHLGKEREGRVATRSIALGIAGGGALLLAIGVLLLWRGRQ